MGRVMTLSGAVDGMATGSVLAAEHVWADLCVSDTAESVNRPQTSQTETSREEEFFGAPFRCEMVSEVLHGRENAEALQLNDSELMAAELASFRSVGGSTIVDLTGHGAGRSVAAL